MAEDYKIRLGDCINSVAYENGFYWETLWNLPENSELKKERKDPNILKVDDIVHIPDIRVKEISKSTEQTHNFRIKGKVKFRLRILEERLPEETAPSSSPPPSGTPPRHLEAEDLIVQIPPREDVPRANTPYILRLDGNTYEGQTDGDGMIDIFIPPNAKNGELTLEQGTPNESFLQVKLGAVEPISEISGIKIRLRNLGFDCGSTDEEESADFGLALLAFQEKYDLEKTGEVNQETRDKLKELHGS